MQIASRAAAAGLSIGSWGKQGVSGAKRLDGQTTEPSEQALNYDFVLFYIVTLKRIV